MTVPLTRPIDDEIRKCLPFSRRKEFSFFENDDPLYDGWDAFFRSVRSRAAADIQTTEPQDTLKAHHENHYAKGQQNKWTAAIYECVLKRVFKCC